MGDGAMSVFQIWVWVMAPSNSLQQLFETAEWGRGSPQTFALFLTVPSGPQSSFPFPAPHPPFQGWPLPDRTQNGNSPFPSLDLK